MDKIRVALSRKNAYAYTYTADAIDKMIPDSIQTPTGSGTSYVHTQNTPDSIWVITHNLGQFPSVTVVDSGENVVIGDIEYTSSNELKLKFNGSFSGKAYLN